VVKLIFTGNTGIKNEANDKDKKGDDDGRRKFPGAKIEKEKKRNLKRSRGPRLRGGRFVGSLQTYAEGERLTLKFPGEMKSRYNAQQDRKQLAGGGGTLAEPTDSTSGSEEKREGGV